MATDEEILVDALKEQRSTLSEKDLGNLYTYLLMTKTRKVDPNERTVVVKQKDIASSFILGNAVNGILGATGLPLGDSGNLILNNTTRGLIETDGIFLGDVSSEDYETIRVVNPGRKFTEQLYGSDFNDTASTTATWTGGGSISFTASGQIAQTLPIYLNNETLSTATLNATDGGNVSYLLSADGGSNWEPVSKGSQHTFTNQGTDLRAMMSASDTSSVTYLEVSY